MLTEKLKNIFRPFHQAIVKGEIDTVHSIVARCQHKHLLNMQNPKGYVSFVF